MMLRSGRPEQTHAARASTRPVPWCSRERRNPQPGLRRAQTMAVRPDPYRGKPRRARAERRLRRHVTWLPHSSWKIKGFGGWHCGRTL